MVGYVPKLSFNQIRACHGEGAPTPSRQRGEKMLHQEQLLHTEFEVTFSVRIRWFIHHQIKMVFFLNYT